MMEKWLFDSRMGQDMLCFRQIFQTHSEDHVVCHSMVTGIPFHGNKAVIA
jgi:hypothetical protein